MIKKEILDILPFINSQREDYQFAGKILNDLKKTGVTIHLWIV